VVSRGAHALTNDPHARCEKALADQDASGRALPEGRGSVERFIRASTLARSGRDKRDPVGAAFGILDNVRQGEYSQWNIVYEPARGRVSWRTRQTPTIKTGQPRRLHARCDGSCAADVMMLDTDAPRPGAAARRFVPSRRERNQALIEKSFAKLPFPVEPGEAARVAAYPDTVSCGAR